VRADVAGLRARGQAALREGDAGAAETTCRLLLDHDSSDIYGLVGLGLAARLRGARHEAMRLFEQAASVHPDNTWPLLEIGAECNALGQPAAAAAALRSALAINPRDYHCLTGMARLLRAAGDPDGAADMLRSAIRHHPRKNTAYGELAGLLRQLGRHEEALAVLEACLGAGCATVAMQIARAEALQACGQLEAALQAHGAVAQDAGASDEQRRDAGFAAFCIARTLKQPDLALDFLEQAAARDAAHVAIQCELACQYRAANRLSEAAVKYQHVLRHTPAHLSALGGLAIVRRQSGDAEAALTLLRQAHGIDAQNEWIRFELALTWRDMGRLDDAGAMLEQIEPGPGIYVWARMTLGHMARARLDHRWAAAYFGQAARHAADPADALCQIAAECRALGDFGAAEAALARVFAQAPNSYQAHMAQGYLRRAQADPHAALEAFRHAAEAAPGQAQALVEMAAEHAGLGDHAAAEAAIAAALRLDPLHEGAALKMAAWRAESGDDDGALDIHARLRQARPASVSPYIAAAQILSDRGEAAAGLDMLDEAARLCPATAQIDLRRAGILRQLGRLDEAYTVLSAVQARFGRELTPWCHLVSAAIDLGRFGEAAALLAAPPPGARHTSARTAMLRAQLDKARWNLDAAITAFGEAIALDPLDSQAPYERAKLRVVTFDLDGARADLVAHSAQRRVAARLDGRSANPSQTHVGQLYDEFSLERGLAGDLVEARGLPADRQIASFASLAQRFPDSTAAAIGLMIALRCAGLLAPRPAVCAETRIPRLITQYWNDAVPPPDVREFMQSWAAAEPGFQIEIFDDAAATNELRAHCGAAIVRAFGMATEPAQRADIFRLARLYRVGGFYIDADDRARGGISPHLRPDATFFAHQEDLGSVGNNVLGAAPGHAVIGAALRGAVNAVLRGDRDIVWLSTGPGLLTRALAHWLASPPAAMAARLATTCVLTLAEMRLVAAMHCHAGYKSTQRAWLNAAFPQRKKALLFEKRSKNF
jgi:tetratricopeptide (TPR) repeat protein